MVSNLLEIVTLRVALVEFAISSVVIGHAVVALLSHRLQPKTSTGIALATIVSAILAVLYAAHADD